MSPTFTCRLTQAVQSYNPTQRTWASEQVNLLLRVLSDSGALWTEKVKRDRPPSELSMSFPRSERQVTSGYVFQIKIFHSTFTTERSAPTITDLDSVKRNGEIGNGKKYQAIYRQFAFDLLLCIFHHYFEEM